MKYTTANSTINNIILDPKGQGNDRTYIAESSFSNIIQCAKAACNKAYVLGKEIKLKFNETVITVYPDSCYEDVCEKYYLLRNQK